MKRLLVNAAWVFLVHAAIVTSAAFGQATFGNISGTVTDPAGAAIPNAQVAITDTERGTTFQTTTNGDGNYTQTHLLASQYKIVFTVPGFSDFSVTASVQVDATTRADARMQIG